MKGVTFFNSRALDVSCRRGSEKDCFCFLQNRPKLVMHMCEVFYGLVGWPPLFYMCSKHTKPLIDLFQVKKSNLSAQDFDILDDGFPPELGSVLL